MKQIINNHHLHLFNFYHESEEPKYLENNLTRALALCLKNDSVLLFAFLKDLLSADDFNYAFYTYDEDATIHFDMQIETRTLVDDTRSLYAIGLTDATINEDWSNISDGIKPIDKRNITDLVITIKDVRIIIEVKKYNHDCKEQLRQQIAPFIERKEDRGHDIALTTKHFCWNSIVNMIEQVENFHNYNGQKNEFSFSFLHLIRTKFSHWIPTKPFKFLNYTTSKADPVLTHEMNRRLLQCIHSLGNGSVDVFWDRTAIRINRAWATEAIPHFEYLEGRGNFLRLMVWPGNTKQQGYSMYEKPMDWVYNSKLSVDGNPYSLIIERHIKFMHFNKYITSIEIPMHETEKWLKKEINTKENHYHHIAGKWYRKDWAELDRIFQSYFTFEWKEECDWDSSFENTDRSYLTVALGYAVSLYIPYEFIQEIDKGPNTFVELGKFLDSCKLAIEDMIDNNHLYQD